MLTAYFDESYNHRTKEKPNEPLVATVACWLSTVELWKKFRIMKDQTVYGCSISINREDYENQILSQKEFARHFGKSWYAYGVRGCIKQLNVWCDQSGYRTDSICYVFGAFPKQGGELDRLFRELMDAPPLRARYRLTGTWSKADMKEVVQVQAADIIAYELNKRAVNSVGSGEQFVRRSLDNLRLRRNFSAEYFDCNSFARQINKKYTGLSW